MSLFDRVVVSLEPLLKTATVPFLREQFPALTAASDAFEAVRAQEAAQAAQQQLLEENPPWLGRALGAVPQAAAQTPSAAPHHRRHYHRHHSAG